MNWIKKRYDQFLLALLAIGLLACAVLIFLKVQNFGENFTTVVAVVPPDNNVKPVKLDKIDEAKETLKTPAAWTPIKFDSDYRASRGSMFASERYIIDAATGSPVRPDKGSLYKNTLTGEPIPNRWFLDNDLPLLEPTAPLQDADKDGFTNEEEWAGKTDPNKKESHPPYYTKLFLAKFIQIPFRLVFKSYDGDPKVDPQGMKMEFQIDTIDLRQPSSFLKLGDSVANTKFKLEKFEFKTAFNPKIQENEDVSELTLVNTETGGKIVLIYNRTINSPDVYALFVYEWPQPALMINVRKLGEFILKPEVDDQHHYKLLDVNETEAQIQLPDGSKRTIKPDPRRPAGK
jgi:hypothetical protein